MPSTEFGGEQIQTSFFDYSEEDRLLTDRGLINFGLPAIDVGSGGSNRVVELRKQGLDIFGVDPLYTDPQSIGEGIVGVAFWSMVENDSYWFDRQNAASKSFEGSLKPRRRLLRNTSVPYIAGSADNLPLQDGSLGTVFDSKFSLSYLADNPEALSAVFLEYKRVLAPGGILLLSSLAALDLGNDEIDQSLLDQLSGRYDNVEQELTEDKEAILSACATSGFHPVVKIDAVFKGGPKQGEHKSSTLVLENLA